MAEQESSENAVEEFHRRFRHDQKCGQVQPVEHYQAISPGYEDLIAREYERLASSEGTPEPRAKKAPDELEFIGPYRILGILGRGGQGEVYLAEDTRLPRRVALKVLPRSLAAIPQAQKRLQREAEAVSRLDHPGVCTIYEIGIDGGRPYAALKYLEGATLAERIRIARDSPGDLGSAFLTLEDGRSPHRLDDVSPSDVSGPRSREEIDEVLEIIEKVARALHAAHRQRLIHRDVKPGNIMVCDTGDPVVLDFGLVQIEGESGITLTGDAVGTPPYMSPEQIATSQRTAHVSVDARTDVYSLGVTLYECLTLTRPFWGATRESLFHAIRTKTPRAPRDANPAISKDLEVVVRTAMAFERDQRYQSAADFAEDLRRISASEPIIARPPNLMTRTWLWINRNRRFAIAAGIVFTVLTLGLIVVLASLGKTRDALEGHQRLADLKDIQDLEEWAERLWPPVPELVEGPEGFNAWVALAERLSERAPLHRETFRDLQARAAPYDEAQRAADLATNRRLMPEVAEMRDRLVAAAGVHGASRSEAASKAVELDRKLARRLTWHFDDKNDLWLYRSLEKMIAKLDGLPALLTDVRARRDFAEDLHRLTIEDQRRAWDETIAGVADKTANPHYRGLQLEPQLGLIPLGRDPQSKLFEFAHLQSGSVPRRDPKSGQWMITKDTGIVLVLIPGELTEIGSDEDERWRRSNEDFRLVNLAPYFMGKYEVTRGQWRRIMKTLPPATMSTAGARPRTDVDPVGSVNWFSCYEFALRCASALPTEAQWEHAARAGSEDMFAWGNRASCLKGKTNIGDMDLKRSGLPLTHGDAVDWSDGSAFQAVVGSYAPNGFGLFDTHGNLSEWCRDMYVIEYPPAAEEPGDGFVAFSKRDMRVQRGGNWYNPVREARCAARASARPQLANAMVGLRVARAVSK